jgi:hypothetical protein
VSWPKASEGGKVLGKETLVVSQPWTLGMMSIQPLILLPRLRNILNS